MSEQREAGRELDAEVAERVFGWGSCEYDTGGARVAGLSYLLVDDRPRPWMHFTSNAAADYTVLGPRRMSSEWRPIESAPTTGETVLLYSPDANEADAIWTGFWLPGDETIPGGWWQSPDDPWPIDAQPTHWQPLPAPPEDQP